MRYWIAQAARQLREEARRKPVNIAGTLSRDQSSIYRFEQGETWPNDTDRVIAAYAVEVGIGDPREIWALALKLWHEQGDTPDLVQLLAEGDPRERFERAIEAGRERRGESAPAARRRAS